MKFYSKEQIKQMQIIIDSINSQYKDLLIKYSNLKHENELLKAIINSPDIDFPNSEKGGQGDQETPLIFPDEF